MTRISEKLSAATDFHLVVLQLDDGLKQRSDRRRRDGRRRRSDGLGRVGVVASFEVHPLQDGLALEQRLHRQSLARITQDVHQLLHFSELLQKKSKNEFQSLTPMHLTGNLGSPISPKNLCSWKLV